MRINRREFSTLLPLGAAAQAQTGATPPPNILLILSDDHSVPYLGCYGYPIRTPQLDKFASEGIRFNKTFTAAPQCVPSRTAILTGRSPVGARMGRFNSPLPPEVVTLPELLKKQKGYYTGIARRNFHLDGPGAAALGPSTKAVFDRHDLRTFARRVDFLDSSGPRTATPKVVTQFLDQVPAGKPFFLWLNFNDPHHVWDKNAIPEPHDPQKLPLAKHLPDLPGVRDDLRRYVDEISRMDEEFGWVMKILEERGLKDNTLVFFMGDNGMAFPHGKGSLYDPGLNVPLLARWPGRIQAGRVSDDLVSGEDITPTLLAAAGATAAREMTGRSFLGHLRGESYAARKFIFGARLYHGSAPLTAESKSSLFDLSRCARSARYKLIYNCTPQMEYQPVDSARDPGWTEMVAAHKAGKLDPAVDRTYFGKRPIFELYDLERDPSELENLAGRPELAAVELELKMALHEKMIVDYDFL
ncbi:MAG: sulfatase, partial [Bryobacteraceae bacterium]|nr:sulfatase [Bryobacteraceae bacterium]